MEIEIICSNCYFWRKDRNDDYKGLCHRYPPIHKSDRGSDIFPYTSHIDWCGEFKERHDK